MTIRLVVTDDHPMVRTGVRSELEYSGADLVIVGEAIDVEGAAATCHEFKPDVALLDVHPPGGREGGDVEVFTRYQDIEGLCFLALSVSDSPEDVVQVIRSGTHGYVTKPISTPELIEAIQHVVSGYLLYISPSPRDRSS